MLADWLILPFKGSSIDLTPEWEVNFKLQVVILLLAECSDEDMSLVNLDSFILESCTSRDVMSVGVLHLYEDRMKVLSPLERWSHKNWLVLLSMKTLKC